MAYRVLIAQFMHETNTFSKLPTTLDDYRKRWLIEGEAMVPRFTGTRNEIGGYIDAVKTYGWQPVWAGAANATPSGKLTKETWETIRDMIVNAARKAGKLDGICLSLHGAMVTETEDDAEGALLELLRGVVGPDVPIATTLDLHANATVRMARNANALVSYRTYPHIDGYERAVQAAALVQAAMEGKKKPRCLLVQPAMLEGAETAATIGTRATHAFCMISKLARPLTMRMCRSSGSRRVRSMWPITLSTALCRPMSSRSTTRIPSVSKRPAACRPPVRSKVDCAAAIESRSRGKSSFAKS